MEALPGSARELLELWFDEASKPFWFRSTPEFDRQLAKRFGALWERGRSGTLADWQTSAEGCLALVILLDQIPLNIFRNQPLSFSTEQASREVAEYAIARGWDKQLDNTRRAFLYLPFMHSESKADQDRSVALFEAAGLNDNLKWARHHRDIVHRFGRFPHRNEILGRESTRDELAYLAGEGAFHG